MVSLPVSRTATLAGQLRWARERFEIGSRAAFDWARFERCDDVCRHEVVASNRSQAENVLALEVKPIGGVASHKALDCRGERLGRSLHILARRPASDGDRGADLDLVLQK